MGALHMATEKYKLTNDASEYPHIKVFHIHKCTEIACKYKMAVYSSIQLISCQQYSMYGFIIRLWFIF